MKIKTSHVIYLFWTSNTIFWVVSIAVLSFSVYMLTTAPLLGTQAISYFLIVIMSTVFMIGFSGCCGGVRIHLRCLHLYVVLVVFFCVEEAAFLIFMLVVGRYKIENLDDSKSFLGMDLAQRSDVQSQNQCCGHNGFMDYLENDVALDVSCFTLVETTDSVEFSVHQNGCKTATLPLINSSIKVYSGFLVVVFMVKFVGLLCAALLMKRIKRQRKRQLAQERKNSKLQEGKERKNSKLPEGKQDV